MESIYVERSKRPHANRTKRKRGKDIGDVTNARHNINRTKHYADKGICGGG